MFQIKNFTSIVAGMINHMRAVQERLTDFNIGSVTRTLIEAPAIEIDELYQQMFHGLKEGIPVAIYSSFDFARIAAAPASGNVRVTITSSADPTLIPAGTVFAPAGSQVRFSSLTDVTIAAGNTYGDVPVAATTSGAATNMVASTVFSLQPSPDGFVSATNLVAFFNGTDEETDDQRKWRFADFIASLNHGTVEAVMYGLRTVALMDSSGLVTERVKYCSVVEPYLDDPENPPAWIQCYIHNGTSGASSELLARAQDVVNGYYENDGTPVSGWKAAGVKADIIAATEVSVAVTATLTAEPGYLASDLIVQVTNAIQAYLLNLDLGGDALRAEIIAAAMAIDGVHNFVVSIPASDTAVGANQKAMPGTFTITAA